MSLPRITYFVESLEESEHAGMPRAEFLEKRVFTEGTMQLLSETRGAVSIATGNMDFAGLVRELNRRKIPVDLWPTLTDEQGYWKYRGNVDATRAKVTEVLDWTRQEQLIVRNIGFDFEPHIGVVRAGKSGKWMEAIRRVLHGLFIQNDPRARSKLQKLIDHVHAMGHGVDVYKIGRIWDKRLERFLLGIHALPERVDTVVSMLYTSIAPVRIAHHLPRGQAPGIGIVSGSDVNPGRDLGTGIRVPSELLTQQQLTRDMHDVRRKGAEHVYVFALNHEEVPRRIVQAWEESATPRS